MKKTTIIFLLFLGIISLSAKKEKQETEYNKALKYLNKSRK